MCGKSHDLVWVRKRGLHVVGVGLSRVALEACVREIQPSGEWASFANLSCYCDQSYELFCGDCFDLNAAAIDDVRGVYERGALVAMPREKRSQYAQQLAASLPTGTLGLLISYAYDQTGTYGPPFSVEQREIESLFGDFLIDLLIEEDSL